MFYASDEDYLHFSVHFIDFIGVGNDLSGLR